MPILRYVALSALVVWIGGMLTLGLLVAPATFEVLQGADPAAGRMLGGLVFGEVLRRFHLLAYVCGGVLFVSLFIMKFVGPPPAGFIVRSAIVATMLAVALYSGMPVSRELDAIQSQVAGPVSSLPAGDLRRQRFDDLHRRSTVLMTVNLGLGFLLLGWYARE
jgi:hypothetical protein